MKMSKFVKSVKKWSGVSRPSSQELNRSQYSLVSCGELTAEAIQLWLGLPKKIKYDPELAPFRQRYEKEFGNLENIPLSSNQSSNGSAPETKRLPLVKSAPHLNNNNIKTLSANDVGVNIKDPEKANNFGKHDEKEEKAQTRKQPTKMSKARHYVKMMLLIAAWIFFTIVFMLYNEKEEIKRNTFVGPGEIKDYFFNASDMENLSVLVKLSGPFLPEHMEKHLNSTELETAEKMTVWLERWTASDGPPAMSKNKEVTASDKWSVLLQEDRYLDFSQGERRTSTIVLGKNTPSSNSTSVHTIRMQTTSKQTIPLTVSYTVNPIDVASGVTYACLLLCSLYVLIIFEIINRTMAAIIVSSSSLAVLALVGERPSVPELISWLDVETLLLLFSMMLLVAITAETGIFDFLAVFTFEVTRGKLWPLISLLCAITGLLSTFLDNVTTVLLMTPVTIRLCEVMNLDPIPILMSMVLFSNIGGTATPVGDPPNVIIASNKAVVQSGINFTNFTLHMTLGIVLVCVQTYFQLRYIYRDTSKLRLNVPRDIQDLRHQISIWRRAIESLPHLSQDQQVVRERLERKVAKLNLKLTALEKESIKRVFPKETFQSTLVELKEKYKIRDKALLIKASIAISFVVIVFFLHSIPELNRVSLGWTALLGAILLLTLADREDLEPILHRVEWSTLLFFASLFVLMEALSKLGLIEFIGSLTESIILKVDESARLAVALLLMLWVSGVTSAFVDNIPLTTMMVRVVTTLGSNPQLGLPMAPLIWALSFGACLGGNGTLIGASANVVCAGVAEQHGYRFSFLHFFRVGFPVMIGHLFVASLYLLLCHCVFTWH
ncbi:PREDICTED: P protein-like [Papilio polytes]|uniref:P protein-like n=1 Tax=Papilio polytes TaxID=76194 RepID=UPI000676954E|nr:PREDICTED: P protein-like [Papilio polytes]XP_013146640.1 PREDICTED: P protein-like [Papilio polytes]XP_013146641.1 PREDICTED: P protein-like [Papilio polytes]XP_013146642.1 PREDICTED: P protein-like [Papilio polytes]XP_013146643.1 PREDICTED: P protein-like [Papilio polytes]XP_013146644.1 PREDICTED: P protein-like [Papilio polytes]